MQPRLTLLPLPFMALLIVLPFPGTVAMRLIFLVLAFAIAAVICLQQPGRCRGFPPALWAIALWLAICSLSLFYSKDIGYSIKEFKNEIVYTLMAFFAFFVICREQRVAILLLRAVAAGLLLIGGIAIVAYARNRMTWPEESLQGGVGIFATYLVTCMPVLFWLSLKDESPRWRRTAQILIVFALILAFLTLQRAVWPALVAEFLSGFFLLQRTGDIKISKTAFLYIVGVVLVSVAIAFSVSNSMRGIPTIASLIPSEQALDTPVAQQRGNDGDSRLPFWPAIVDTIADHPLTGTGFGQGMMKKVYPELTPISFPSLWHAHNVVLNYGIQMGIPGALALLLLFFGLVHFFWRCLRENPSMAVAAIAGIMLVVGVLMRNQTNDFFRRDMALLFWSLIGIFSAMALPTLPTLPKKPTA